METATTRNSPPQAQLVADFYCVYIVVPVTNLLMGNSDRDFTHLLWEWVYYVTHCDKRETSNPL